jgi:hypothetical protein
MNKSLRKQRKLRGILFFLSLLSLFLFNNAVKADRYMRCKGRLVSIGDTKAEVLDKCDHPDRRDQWEEDHNGTVSQIYDYETERYIAPKHIEQPIQMERWTYNMGVNRFIRYLYFQNGELIKIETGEKGRD